MKKILLVSAVSMAIYACGSGIDERKLAGYSDDVCTCASKAKSQDEWNACNEQRKQFFSAMGLDKDDAEANKYNDQMYDCLSEHDKY